MPDSTERMDRIEQNLERLTAVVSTLANTTVAHDTQIEQLLAIAEENQNNWKQLQREWQAYLNTIHPKH
jgi:archaellum component FlaC